MLTLSASGGLASAGIISQIVAPDITAAYVRANYGVPYAEENELRLDGYAVNLENPADVFHRIYRGSGSTAPGAFSLRANITSTGEFLGGEFDVQGTLEQSESSVTLLRGTLTEAYTASFESNGQLEFVGGNLSGSLAPLFGGVDTFGIRVSNLNGYSFASSFTTGFFSTAVTDIGRAVPEPSSFAIFGSAIVLGCFRSRTRKKRRGS